MKKVLKYETVEKFIKNTKIEKIGINNEQKIKLIELLNANIFITNSERSSIIYNFIFYDVKENWVENLLKLRKLKLRAPSLEVYQLKFGIELGNKKHKEYCENLCRSKKSFIKKYGEEEGIKKYNNFCNVRKGNSTIESFIKKHGEEEGNKRWEYYQNKRKEKYKERKEKGIKFNNGRDLEGFIRIHGEKEGFKKWNERNSNHSKRFSVDYYIEKYGKEEGLNKWEEYKKSMDKTSLKQFIKKYGQEEGLNRYKEFSKKQKEGNKANTLENFIINYGPFLGKEKYENFIKKCAEYSSKNRFSKISQRLFWEIYELLKEDKKDLVKFAELNGEEIFYLFEKQRKFYVVDFKCNNIIIEYNSEYTHNYNIPEILEYDLKRIEYLESKGYKILTVWDKNYKKNKIEVIQECLKFINDEYKS